MLLGGFMLPQTDLTTQQVCFRNLYDPIIPQACKGLLENTIVTKNKTTLSLSNAISSEREDNVHENTTNAGIL